MALNLTSCEASVPAWHQGFLSMLPIIRHQASLAFRDRDKESREDLVAEAVANALVAYVRLVQRGRADLAYPTVLALYAVRQIRDGRRVGTRLNIKEVLSQYAQQNKRFHVERLDRYDHHTGEWREAVVEDRETPVPDQAAFRIDFPRWLAGHSPRDREIAESLATGDRTGDVARRFHISAGRVSQLRREFYESWEEFHGEKTAAA